MNIVMHCGGMPFNGATFGRESLGGSESAAYYLARELAKKGHRVTLFTNHPDEGEWDGVAYRFAGERTENTPLGDRYQVYAVATPHDLNITERNPSAFVLPVAAKVRAWWLHDVPHQAHGGAVRANLLGTDLIFTVSNWHREQVIDAWGVNPDNVVSIENGVDLELFDGATDVSKFVMPDQFRLLYTSRPERGLETLVQPGGVMERLANAGSSAHLYVCGYDNVTAHMAQYYDWLYARCKALPNVTNLGHLGKRELADVMRQCDLLAYPTVFNETSCITAMEAMAAGLPMLSSACGALPETCDGSGAVLLPLVDASRPRPGAMEAGDPTKEVDIDAFVEFITGFETKALLAEIKRVRDAQLEAAKRHTWDLVADRVEGAVRGVFGRATLPSKVRQLMRDSDFYALKDAVEGQMPNPVDAITAQTLGEMAECYAFTSEPSWDEHYREYYEYEKERGVDYGPENLDHNHRFEYVSSLVAALNPGAVVLDYGCAHGHYTVNLAKRFPELRFVGLDITPSNVEKAKAWAEAEGVGNVDFFVGRVEPGKQLIVHNSLDPLGLFDMVIAAEVLEHVADPQHHIDVLNAHLRDGGGMCITVPYGPWEAQGYEQHWPWRAHVHHFERSDLHDMVGHFPGFAVTVISAGRSPQGDPLGYYVAVWGKPDAGARGAQPVDYARKWAELAPRQTLSVCMIVKDAEEGISAAIRSVAGIADEFVIRIDETSTDATPQRLTEALQKYAPHTAARVETGPGPLEIGFDAARNGTVEAASGDWVLWMDADEVLDGAEHLVPYLRNNCYQGYALPHHHFSIEPAGLLKTDYPCRVFRNHIGISFRGVVHEHPEVALNEGIPHTAVLDNVVVAHYGYTNEETRRRRFNRNYPLMVRDRQQYPDRYLGKFLWVRDLFQVCRYELEAGSGVTDRMVDRAFEGVALWESLLRDAPLRLAIESLEWYSGLVEILGGGVAYSIAIKGSQELSATGVFRDERHANMLAARMMKEG